MICPLLLALAVQSPRAQSQTASTAQAQSTTKPRRARRPHHALRHAHTRALIAAAVAHGQAVPGGVAATADFDPPEQTVGERLFLETRFAQFFAAHYDGNVNHVLPAGQGDPTVSYVHSTIPTDKILGPFVGTSINCRSCHFVDDVDNGNRTYADYTRRSPIPDRADNHVTAPRNALNMVDSNIARSAGLLLHGDGEFATVEELIDSTMTGRNFGWLPTEYDNAEAHIAKIIREDDGSGILAKDYASLSYSTLFLGTSPSITSDLLIPAAYRINVAIFLTRAPDVTAKRLQNKALWLATGVPGLGFFVLGCISLRRKRPSLLAIAVAGFLSCGLVACGGGTSGNVIAPPSTTPVAEVARIGNCVACHVAPDFSDFQMHNTGASQEEYDAIHGDGSFAQLAVPSYADRQANRDLYLPPTPQHPSSSGRFRSPALATDATLADLGPWNVYANTDYPDPQPRVQAIMCPQGGACDPNQVLPLTIGRFKTPVLRDLAQSQPYLHTGRMDTIEKVLDFYRHTALLAQSGKLRNADPKIAQVSIDVNDEAALAAFLRSLNEDYQ